MKTIATAGPLPFQVGEARAFRSLVLYPLFPAREPVLDYVGLDEALAGGLEVSEVGSRGAVDTLLVDNPLSRPVLLYEGEELTGMKQNRMVERTVLVPPRTALKIPVACVEQGRWSAPRPARAAPHAAFPALRRAARWGQEAAWEEIAERGRRLGARSPTQAAAALYGHRRGDLDEYVAALPRLPGQAGCLAAAGGRLLCLDYVSRADVFAGLYRKLVRGYALEAAGSGEPCLPLSPASVGRFLGELEIAPRAAQGAWGLGEDRVINGYVIGRELLVDGEVVALAVLPATA